MLSAHEKVDNPDVYPGVDEEICSKKVQRSFLDDAGLFVKLFSCGIFRTVMAGLSKRLRLVECNYEDALLKWFEEATSDRGSDIDDVPKDYHMESEHDSSSELSDTEDVPGNNAVDVTETDSVLQKFVRRRRD
ncbi:hypothetical protein FQA39_LY05284 [Lamprigera yunnana]|nr:hypothetical protein FQA39_LY05284 [Lamprigera yunnana]